MIEPLEPFNDRCKRHKLRFGLDLGLLPFDQMIAIVMQRDL
jgi:hypothetical protein